MTFQRLKKEIINPAVPVKAGALTHACIGVLAVMTFALAGSPAEAATKKPVKAPVAEAPAEPAPNPSDFPRVNVRVGVHDDFQRVVFDWPMKIGFNAKQDGNVLTLRFEKAAAIDLSPISRKPITVVKSLEQKVDDNAVIVTMQLNDKVTSETFQDGLRVIIDFKSDGPLIGATDAPAETAAPAPAPVAAPAAAPVKADTAAIINSESKSDDLTPLEGDTVTSPDAMKKPRADYTPPKLDAVGLEPALLLAIDTATPTPAAVFRRGSFVYIVFDRKLGMPLTQMVKGTPLVKPEVIQADTATVLRFYMPQKLNLRIMRDDALWSIYAAQGTPTAPISLTPVAQPSYALGARLVLPLSKTGDVVRFYDPEVGTQLIAVPLLQSGQAVRLRYDFADLDFVPAEQGIVVAPHIDGIEVKRQALGVEITGRKGLRLSPDADTGIASETGRSANSLYDFRSWYGPAAEGYTAMRQRLERALSEVPIADRNRMRFDMARFDFARGHPQEGLGLLNMLERDVPDIALRSEFQALRGAIRVLTRDSDNAVKDLDHPDLRENNEAHLWQAVAYARLLNWKKSNELFVESDSVLGEYPDPFFTDFSIVAAEAGLAAGNNVFAAKVLDRLVERHPELENNSAAVHYLRGVFLSIAGHLDRAEELWKKAQVGDQPMYRVRATLALTDLDVVRGKIKPAQAAERLERLRFAWRGDDLELDVLRRLGKFYIEAGKVADGLAVLKQVLAFLPDNESAKKLRDEMAFAFRDVFLGDRGKDLSPLDALSLYERFYELAPVGDEGDAIIRNLAARMVEVDLLDRAAAILSDQVRRRLASTFKSRVGAQAAGIDLLDRKAEAALQILADSEVPNTPPELVDERNLLKAKAVAELGRKQDALEILKTIKGEDADRLRADIAWKSRDWPEAAKILERLVGPAPEEGEDPNPKQSLLVINRAIALAMANDVAGLEAMRQVYGASMKKTPQAELFRSLTEPESGLPKGDDAMKAFSTDVDLFQEYLENYRKIR